MELRGHEFHYSNVVAPDAMPSVAKQFTARGMEVSTPLYRYKNVGLRIARVRSCAICIPIAPQ